ncbi:CYFA0S13e03488g1_1 [Cyberlindnera fabianii]|uniref:Methionine aminopeptidase n=1 Tax=Cyberlindnera fabianii TaxID=36022 RepID=A0A061B2G6_CYBFA|nr:Methionine aminopeptidase 1 [Cyberlindnera fabianii]CDR44104.1 CYFA0S13e03488g1_1 [Cyberlindnera fabianii]
MTATIHCSSPNCGKVTTSTLKCPMCLKQGITSVFCDQACFKKAWPIHKAIHTKPGVESYDPFPQFPYAGPLRPAYPLSPRRTIPDNVPTTDYHEDGAPTSEILNDRTSKIPIYNEEELKMIRKAADIGREVLDIAAAAAKVGVTTDAIDEIVHRETIARGGYPSPLNYYNFPKSVCTSVNEVICHGIPDKRPLKDGDILNIDISVYYQGYHADLNETYYIGTPSKEAINVVETARECLDLAIATCKPGVTFRSLGDVIEKHAKANGCSVVRSFCGHGTGKYFHCAPSVAHYARNKSPGIMKPGMVFTIEPMINVGTYKDICWPDDWTVTTSDGKLSAQFEHELLVTETGVEVLSARKENSPGGALTRK